MSTADCHLRDFEPLDAAADISSCLPANNSGQSPVPLPTSKCLAVLADGVLTRVECQSLIARAKPAIKG